MYTPGICVTHPYHRKRTHEAEQVEPKARTGRMGKFFRAACLVIICIVLSAGAAYGAVEYRISRGDFDVVNHVVLGGAGNQPSQSGLATPVTTTGARMSAEDIYDMALTQVVVIKAEVPGSGMFSSQGTSIVAGSGFIISADGYLLTNFHVIEPALQSRSPIAVILQDGSEYEAEAIGYDTASDVALLKIDAAGLNPAVIANSDNIRVGQTVYAVGNPFGDLVFSMTDGIVSALDRVVTVDNKIIGTFQFSAAVNSGNSGGPIYDTNGEVIGIVTAKVMRGSVEGIGFAIPINDAIEIAAGLIEHGYIAGRPLMGISAETVAGIHADYYEWVVGVLIREVIPGSAAETAGLLVGDIITAIDGTQVDSLDTLRFTLRRHRAGETTPVTIWRNGETIEMKITFDEDMAAGRPLDR